jgi:hypothetical protein
MNLDDLILYVENFKKKFPLRNYKDIPIKFKTKQNSKKTYKIGHFDAIVSVSYKTKDNGIITQVNIGEMTFYEKKELKK